VLPKESLIQARSHQTGPNRESGGMLEASKLADIPPYIWRCEAGDGRYNQGGTIK